MMRMQPKGEIAESKATPTATGMRTRARTEQANGGKLLSSNTAVESAAASPPLAAIGTKASSSSSAAAAAPTRPTSGRVRSRAPAESSGRPQSSSSDAAEAVQQSTERTLKSAKRKRVTTSSDAAAASAAQPLNRTESQKKGRVRSSAEPVTSKKRAKNSPKPLEGVVNCGICFEESFDFAGILNCCRHWYCFECIQKWSESSNTCPQCKRRFRSIAKTEVSTGRKEKTLQVKKRDLSSSRGIAPLGIGLPVEPLFGLFGTQAGHTLTPLEFFHLLGHEHALPVTLFSALFHDDEYYSSSDDDDEDDGDRMCGCCGAQWYGAYPGEPCPGCGCHGHDDDDDDSPEDRVVVVTSSSSSQVLRGEGSREQPFELDES